MGKTTKPLSGQSQRKYFRDLFRADPGVTAEAAVRLTEACASEIAQIRVRLPLAVRRPARAIMAAAGQSERVVESVPVPAALAATGLTAAARPEPEAQAGPVFDPHAFSLIVVLRKGGKDGLLAKLAEIAQIAQLRAIADAQHVSLDAALTDRAAICAAIVAGTERRLAHRQAAAS